MQLSDTDYRDMQGLVRFGYGHLKEARYHLLTIVDVAAARAWLAAAPVTTGEKGPKPTTALNVALTYEGLQRLGSPSGALAQLPYEFKSGMNESNRARRLGDVESNDPKWWEWGGAGKVPHVLVMTYADTPERLDTWETELKTASWNAGFSAMASLPTLDIGEIEPFGFDDGVSQPALDWERTKSERIRDTTEHTNLAALGEVLLGYPNEYGLYTDRPLVDAADDPKGILPAAEDVAGKKDLGRNGTYLVFRDLVQDAPEFWKFVNEQAAADQEELNITAAATVGRVPSHIPVLSTSRKPVVPTSTATAGAPLVALSLQPIPGVGPDPNDIARNQFTFHNDVDAVACPYGAHVRRTNPRTADLPEGTRGLFAKFLRILGFGREHPHDDLIASTRFHRILRRGREYVIEATGTGGERVVQRGLRFICLNANISRQFEFIQASWIANPKFEGLDETDPLLGIRTPLVTGRATSAFTRPQPNGACRRSAPLPQFVRVVGGAYFFMPGISALRYLSS